MEGQRGGGLATCRVLPLFRSAFATRGWKDSRNVRTLHYVMGRDAQDKIGFETNFTYMTLSQQEEDAPRNLQKWLA